MKRAPLLSAATMVLAGAGWALLPDAVETSVHAQGAAAARSGTKAAARTGSMEMWGGMVNVFAAQTKAQATASRRDTEDLESVLADVLRQPPGPQRIEMLRAAFESLMLHSPTLALAALARIPPAERQRVAAVALARLAEQRPEDFLNNVATLEDSARYMESALGVLATKNPGLALELVWRSSTSPQMQATALGAIWPQLVQADLALAAQAVAQLGPLTSSAQIQQVAGAMARTEPAHAYDWAARLLATRGDLSASQLFGDVATQLAAADVVAAAGLLDRSSDPDVRKSLMSGISSRKAQDDLSAAWTWLSKYRADAAFSETAVDLFYRWCYAKPGEVAQVLPAVDDPVVQAAAAAQLARFWRARDPKAYEAWLTGLPPGALRDGALARY